MSEETKVVEKAKNKGQKKWLLLLLIPILLLIAFWGYRSVSTVSEGELARFLEADGTDSLHIMGTVKVTEPLNVKGTKTLTGSGKIVLTETLAGKFPDEDSKNNSWGMGCTELNIEDTDSMAAFLNVNEGAEIIIDNSITIDAEKKANAVFVANGGKFVLDGKATVKAGRYANVIIAEGGEAEVKGGNVESAVSYGIINKGTLVISGGNLLGSEKGAVLYNEGTAKQSGGTIAEAGVHNVYVAAGSFEMTGGTNTKAAKDGIYTAEGAKADITGGDITFSVHGLCNSGNMNVGKVTLNEAGIMNYKTGVLDLNETTVDTAAVYCLANNGGKVTANKFTAAKCDTCAIYNFAGDMELTDVTVTGSRDGNITNGGGNLVVKGGNFDKARDKSIIVGNGKAVFEDVVVAGTAREKYGVYVYGGELFMTKVEIFDVSSTAFKVDTGGYIEVKDVDMKDIAEIGFRSDGGKIVADTVTMTNLGSHAVYNMSGDITLTNAVIDTVEKNVIQQKGGNTVLRKTNVENIGNHTAYIELGKVTVEDSAFKTMAGNGFYLVEGDNEAVLKNVTLDGVEKQGINNQSKVTIDGLKVKNAKQNGIFNKDKGTITAKNVEISSVGEHGVNNYNKMTLTDSKISNTGKGSNGLQNKGTLTIEKVSVAKSKNHGVYNIGTVSGSDLSINGASKNGVYNNKGKFNVAKIAVSGTGEHGLNNQASMSVSGVTVKDTGKGKNSVQNSGTLTLTNAALSGSKNHGIYNTGTVTGKDVKVEKTAKNGIYVTKGQVEINGLNVKDTGEHGINNEATVTVANATISATGAGKNSIQNRGKVTVSDSLLKNSKNHGIYNTGKLEITEVTIQDITKNGIYNDEKGTMKATGLEVKKTGEHGINNAATMTVADSTIATPGTGKNCIQNTGKATVQNTELKDSPNHGIYNVGEVKTKGTFTVSNVEKNAIYNYENGKFTAAKVVINKTGDHGINNTATFKADEVFVNGAASNSIQNSGSFTIVKKATLAESGKHGLYNGEDFVGNNISIKGAGDLGASNSGDMEIHGLNITGKAHKALYNSGYAELYKATIDGAEIANTANAEFLVDNNGGVLDLTASTILNAKGTALHNRGNAATSVTNVVIDKAGNYGTFVEKGSTLSGDGFEVNNVVKGFKGAEGMPIKNAGKITMMDHVTLGADDPEVTGSGVKTSAELKEIVNNAVVNDATTAGYSGYDLTIQNATGGCAIYNKGYAFITDMTADKAKDGVVSRYSGWATLAGNISLTNSTRNPLVTYGPEKGNYKNGITVASGTTMVVDGTNGHGINNKGSFLAAADTDITFKNIKGNNVNAVNNQSKAVMTLGDVTVDGVYANITMYNDTTINSNSGNGIITSGSLTLNGKAEISNIYSNPANNKTDNSNAAGVVVKNGGTLKGEGSISIKGNGAGTVNGTAYTQGVHNGIFTTKCTIDLKGDISVDTVKNQGIYVADAKAVLKANNITVKNVASGHGIYVNNATGLVEAAGSIITDNAQRGLYTLGTVKVGENVNVSNTKNHGIELDGTGEKNGTLTVGGNVTVKDTAYEKQGINVNGAKAKLEAANITIENAGGNGLWINNAAGSVKASGTIKVDKTGKGRGIGNSGVIEAGNIEVSGVTNYAGIENSKTITVSGNVTVSDITNGPGIRNKGTLTVQGTTTIKDISGEKANGIQQDGGKTSNLKDVVITNISSTTLGSNYGNGIYTKGTINLSGKAVIKNIKLEGASLDTEGSGIVNAEAGKTIKGEGSIEISDVTRNGITNLGTIEVKDIVISKAGYRAIGSNAGIFKAENITVSETGNVGIYMENKSSMEVKKLTVKDILNQQGVQLQHANTLLAEEVFIQNMSKNGLRLYNNNSNPTVTIGKLTVRDCVEYGIAAQKKLTDENINVAEMWYLNCGKGAVHGNIKSGVATPQQLTQ